MFKSISKQDGETVAATHGIKVTGWGLESLQPDNNPKESSRAPPPNITMEILVSI